jgi:hypothetical protein
VTPWFSKLRRRSDLTSPAVIDTTARVTIANDTQRPLHVIFEPWCQTYDLAPGVKYVFEATSPLPGWLRVEPRENEVTVHAWDGCVARVHDAEGRIIDVIDIRVPDFSSTTAATSLPAG